MAEAQRTSTRPGLPLVAGMLVLMLATFGVALHRTGHPLPGLEALERRTLDLRFQLRGPRPPGPETAVVVFDDRTLAQLPDLFEKRDGMARVLTALHDAGARVVGVDALFSDHEQILPGPLVGDIHGYLGAHVGADTPADTLLRRVAYETEGDERLLSAIKAAGNVVLGLHMGETGGGGRKVASASLTRGKYGQVVRGPWEPREATDVAASLPELNRAARALGIITVYEDESHTMRELPLVRRYEHGYYAPLAVQLVAAYRGLSRGQLVYSGADHAIRIGHQTVPLDANDAMLLNYRGPPGTFPNYSVLDLMQGKLPEGALSRKIVVLGFSVLGSDLLRTSFGNTFRGPEMHATAVDNLLRNDPLTRAPWRTDALISFALGLAIVILFWPRLGLGPGVQVAATALFLGGYLFASFELFSRLGLWTSWTGPLLTGLAVMTTCVVTSYAREGLERRRLRHAFGRYLSEEVIGELLANPSALSLGGSRRELTVLFSDVRNFTSISERLSPEQLVHVLNSYLTPMTRAVLAQGGFLDKFIGDAVMAVFGAPLPNPRHPEQACACALRMFEELRALRPAFAELGVPIEIGIGLNTGEMVVGNMGSEEHFNYTVMGDAVNLASRLEGLTKTYGAFCLVGAETRARAGEAFRFRELDLVQVKGKAEPVAIFELLSGPGTEIARWTELPRWDRALAAYRAGRFDEAREDFRAFALANPEDHAAPLFLERLEGLAQSAPPEWDGVWVYRTK